MKETGIRFTFLQPGFFMQNFLMFAGSIRTAGEFYLPLGDARVSFVDTRDIAAVGAATLTGDDHENKFYTITGPEALTCADVAGILTDTAGRQVRFVDVPPEAAKQGMIGVGMPPKLADLINELYALGPAGHLAHVSDAVEMTTGKRPRSFHQFAEDHAAAFRD